MEQFNEYWIEVKRHVRAQKPFRWVIFRSGRALPIKRSPMTFKSQIVARAAGDRVLTRLLDKRNSDARFSTDERIPLAQDKTRRPP